MIHGLKYAYRSVQKWNLNRGAPVPEHFETPKCPRDAAEAEPGWTDGAMEQTSHYADSPSFERFAEGAVLLTRANDELVAARTTIVDLLASIEDILLRQNPRIEAEWQVTIGVWENSLLEAQIAMRRAKRKCNLIQACVNRGATVELQKIETQLDTEFEQWRQQLEESVLHYQCAVQSHMSMVRLTAADADLQKKLFRTLAKRLHPDLNPGLDESARRMFALAELAYQQGDTKILQSLEVSTRTFEPKTQLPKTVIEAEAELAVLNAQIGQLQERIEQIKAEKPYCLRVQLDDGAWVEAHIGQIKGEIETCQQTERQYRARCEEIGSAHE